MRTGSAFGLGFALSVVVMFSLNSLLSDDVINALGAVIGFDHARQLGILIVMIVPGLVFFGVPLINAKCIDARERRRAEAEESRKRKYQDNPLAGELAEKVYQSMVHGIEGADRGKRVQIISVVRTVKFDHFGSRIELRGPGAPNLLYNGASEYVVFSEPDAFVYSICAIVLDRLREKYHADPSGGKIATLRVKPDKSISSKDVEYCIKYEAWNPNYEKPKVI